MPTGFYRLRRNSKRQFYLSGPIQGIRINTSDRLDVLESIKKKERLQLKYKTKIYVRRMPETDDSFQARTSFLPLLDGPRSAPILLDRVPISHTFEEVHYYLAEQKRLMREYFKNKYSLDYKPVVIP